MAVCAWPGCQDDASEVFLLRRSDEDPSGKGRHVGLCPTHAEWARAEQWRGTKLWMERRAARAEGRRKAPEQLSLHF